MGNKLNLYIKLGNQFFFFIFADEEIHKTYIIPSYITLKDGILHKIGPYSLLQYLIFKQAHRIPNYPTFIEHKNFVFRALINENFIVDLKLFFEVFKIIFSYSLHNFYGIDNFNDYKRYFIPYFEDWENFYGLLEDSREIFCINFLDSRGSYFVNHYKFLKDLFGYFRRKLKVINFSDFFYKFFGGGLNFYFGEYNSVIWIRNEYGFFLSKTLDINKRAIKELVFKKAIDNGEILTFLELEKISSEIFEFFENFKENYRFDFASIRRAFYYHLLNSIKDFLVQLPTSILEDVYNSCLLNNSKFFSSVVSYESRFKELLLEVFYDVLIK